MSASVKILAELIKRLRNLTGLTQVQFARQLGVTPTSIHRYEAGSSTPSTAVLHELFSFAAQDPRLATERDSLRKQLDERSNPFAVTMDMSFRDSHKRASAKGVRPLLDVNVLAKLTQEEHEILEATLAVLRSRDSTAKRVLRSLLAPWTLKTEASDE